ncbi:deoxyribonuclease gamma-like isoform X2 [Petromyzon marinus]|uniref:Deoxyribonuclease n=1 Tax=Petromyzon marinus TaxID=7757 RepID=S4RE31_PETMA|nr:deoxyribonuclease gamma-like isoform X2 [Petromyzon marinus]
MCEGRTTRGHAGALWLSLLLSLVCGGASSDLKICSFNIQTFGQAKASKPHVMEIIVKIISRCDVTLVMEIRDCKNCTLPRLMEQLNNQHRGHPYSYVASKRLGRGSYREQYAFVYRSNLVKLRDSHQYKENDAQGPCVFLREPFSVRFHSPKTAVQDLILVGQHTSPKSAVSELQKLHTVFEEVVRLWGNQNVMLLGDFNAACGYVSATNWSHVRIRDPSFHWAIGDDVDTTVNKNTDCAYDRIVVHGTELRSALVAGSARAFNFQKKYGLSNEKALEVSDHYPVEVKLKVPVHHHEL